MSAPLPQLPLRPLKDVCAAYLKSTKPHLSIKEYAHTTALVREFMRPGGDGEHLHELLIKRKSSRVNWLEEWWLKVCPLSLSLQALPRMAPAHGHALGTFILFPSPSRSLSSFPFCLLFLIIIILFVFIIFQVALSSSICFYNHSPSRRAVCLPGVPRAPSHQLQSEQFIWAPCRYNRR